MTTAEARSVVDQLAELGALHLTLTGGEVLLRKDFLDIARYAREKGFALRLLTNGSLITASVADALRDLHLVGVEMSLLGAQSSTHDRLTGAAGSFERTLGAFRLLAERGVHATVKTPLMNDNIGEFDQVRRLAGELGAAFRYDITIVPKDSGCACVLSHRLTDESLLNLFQRELPDRWVAPTVSPEDHPCSAASNQLCINPYGDVFPCVQIRLSAGNVRVQSLGKIWSESPQLGEIRGLVEASFPVCSTCRLRPYCVRCMGLGRLEDGELSGPSSVACREAALRRQVVLEREPSLD